MIQDILAFAHEKVSEGRQVVLVTVTDTSGSSPASVGQVMAVLADGTSVGTVGGGTTEHLIIQRAVEALKNGERVFKFTYNHTEIGMACGGEMSGFGVVMGSENHLYIFGGGHIAQKLAPLAVATGFFVTVVEDRPDLESAFSGVQYIVSLPEEYEKKVKMTGSAYVVICTRGHRTDYDALHFVLTKPTRYVGMIGSRKKVASVFDRLREEGFEENVINKIYAPIGLDIADEIPAEIAVAILAEILLVKNGGSPKHKKITGQVD